MIAGFTYRASSESTIIPTQLLGKLTDDIVLTFSYVETWGHVTFRDLETILCSRRFLVTEIDCRDMDMDMVNEGSSAESVLSFNVPSHSSTSTSLCMKMRMKSLRLRCICSWKSLRHVSNLSSKSLRRRISI
jgi:hypothetical protein